MIKIGSVLLLLQEKRKHVSTVVSPEVEENMISINQKNDARKPPNT